MSRFVRLGLSLALVACRPAPALDISRPEKGAAPAADVIAVEPFPDEGRTP